MRTCDDCGKTLASSWCWLAMYNDGDDDWYPVGVFTSLEKAQGAIESERARMSLPPGNWEKPKTYISTSGGVDTTTGTISHVRIDNIGG